MSEGQTLRQDLRLIIALLLVAAMMAALLFFGIPRWCNDTPVGSSSPKGVVCAPFLDYAAIKLVLVMLFSFKFRSSTYDALERWKTIGFGLASVRNLLPRVFLQVVQWWGVMLVALCALTIALFLKISQLWDYSLADAMQHGWVSEAPESMHNIPKWLAVFSINSLLMMVWVSIISAFVIFLQVLSHLSSNGWSLLTCALRSDGPAILSFPRDLAVQVLMLPIVYSYLAASNVERMWENLTDTFDPNEVRSAGNETTLKEINREIYESNFSVADMYEAWALFCFARMVWQVVRPELRKKLKVDAVDTFEGLLLTNVSVFVGVCAVGSLYLITVTWFRLRLKVEICESDPWSAICAVTPYLSGANLVVSSIAIYNLFTFEEKFHQFQSMHQFGPRLKFWSIKLMVLVAFWVGILMGGLQIIFHLTPDEGMLFDASMRIYVMALVSWLNIAAWWPCKQWYSKVANHLEESSDVEKSEAVSRGRAASHALLTHRNPVPQHTLDLVSNIFPSFDENAASDWRKVESHIRELDVKSLTDALERGKSFEAENGKVWAPGRIGGGRKARNQLVSHLRSMYPRELA